MNLQLMASMLLAILIVFVVAVIAMRLGSKEERVEKILEKEKKKQYEKSLKEIKVERHEHLKGE